MRNTLGGSIMVEEESSRAEIDSGAVTGANGEYLKARFL